VLAPARTSSDSTILAIASGDDTPTGGFQEALRFRLNSGEDMDQCKDQYHDHGYKDQPLRRARGLRVAVRAALLVPAFAVLGLVRVRRSGVPAQHAERRD
jgi:hypothetical protein